VVVGQQATRTSTSCGPQWSRWSTDGTEPGTAIEPIWPNRGGGLDLYTKIVLQDLAVEHIELALRKDLAAQIDEHIIRIHHNT
jgi:hypothetical protein